MNQPFRNAGVRSAVYVLAAAVPAGFWLAISARSWQGYAAFCLVAAVCACFVFATFRRYRLLAGLAEEISIVLHGREAMRLSEFSEGELSILQSEVVKMTVRLREQAERLAGEKTRLSDAIADISHQLRTPLTSVRLLVSLLEEPDLPPLRRAALQKELEQLLDRTGWLIEALLKLSKLDTGTAGLQSAPVLVSALLQKASTPLAVPMEIRGQRLEIDIEGEPSFPGDMAWSTEAVGNILKNCMEHTPAGGEIRCMARKNAIFTEIQICDTGPGIPKEEQGRVFDRFFKGKNASPASVGIGLALARQIIAAQNGTVKVLDRPGGACFAIRFYKGAV